MALENRLVSILSTASRTVQIVTLLSGKSKVNCIPFALASTENLIEMDFISSSRQTLLSCGVWELTWAEE